MVLEQCLAFLHAFTAESHLFVKLLERLINLGEFLRGIYLLALLICTVYLTF